jgi:hypothetical protein
LQPYNGGGPFQEADAATRLRGLSKLGAAGFLVISASRWATGVDPTIPLTFAVVWGGVWLLTCPWVNKIEPLAKAAMVDLQGRK